ncbi:MAG: hypothetical protein IPM91_16850 [Bacteroidetes bacterium]|nr:hypothetical protein [Bacteroidota bacterium]
MDQAITMAVAVVHQPEQLLQVLTDQPPMAVLHLRVVVMVETEEPRLTVMDYRDLYQEVVEAV